LSRRLIPAAKIPRHQDEERDSGKPGLLKLKALADQQGSKEIVAEQADDTR
jgi:hypothetical protein